MIKRLILVLAVFSAGPALADIKLTPKEEAMRDRDAALRGYKPTAAEIRKKERENDFRRVDTREKRRTETSYRPRAGTRIGRRL